MSSKLTPLLKVNDLVTVFDTPKGVLRAVDGVSFQIAAGETVGLVGESGCGKSVTGLSLMRLVQQPPGRIAGGTIFLGDTDLLTLSERDMRKVRGAKISMIFQEPMTSLNPVFTIGNQLIEGIILHQHLSRQSALLMAQTLLTEVGIGNPQERLMAYPHELSGGMRQRVMIAMALACKPQLLIADEPTTALDVTIQAQILELLKSIQRQYQMGILLISHNLGVVATLCKRVIVMYAGRIVEMTTTQELYDRPLHPYTKGLYASLPSVARMQGNKRLQAIPGTVPGLDQLPKGCKFRNRCSLATALCEQVEPELRELRPGHWVRCVHANG